LTGNTKKCRRDGPSSSGVPSASIFPISLERMLLRVPRICRSRKGRRGSVYVVARKLKENTPLDNNIKKKKIPRGEATPGRCLPALRGTIRRSRIAELNRRGEEAIRLLSLCMAAGKKLALLGSKT